MKPGLCPHTTQCLDDEFLDHMKGGVRLSQLAVPLIPVDTTQFEAGRPTVAPVSIVRTDMNVLMLQSSEYLVSRLVRSPLEGDYSPKNSPRDAHDESPNKRGGCYTVPVFRVRRIRPLGHRTTVRTQFKAVAGVDF